MQHRDIPSGPKSPSILHNFVANREILADYHNSFIIPFSGKFAISYAPHIKRAGCYTILRNANVRELVNQRNNITSFRCTKLKFNEHFNTLSQASFLLAYHSVLKMSTIHQLRISRSRGSLIRSTNSPRDTVIMLALGHLLLGS